MAKTVLGIFDERNEAEDAINSLKEYGFNPKDISIIMKDTSEGKEMAGDTGADVAGGAASGATTGAIIGGIAGLAASFMIPGLGAFFIGGPIASALGLTGAAATTASGAVTGALAGGLLGALMSLGLPEEDAKRYEERIKAGAILLAVPARAADVRNVEDILEDCNASDMRVVSMQDDEYSDDEEEDHRDYEPPEDRDEDYTRPHAYAGAKGGRAGRRSSLTRQKKTTRFEDNGGRSSGRRKAD